MMGWYRRLRLRNRIILMVLSSLGAIVAGYVSIRFAQYQVYASVPLETFLPDRNDVMVVLRSPHDQWHRVQQTDLFRIVGEGVLNDPGLRPSISKWLVDSGWPSLDELADKRFRKRWGDALTEDFLFRFFKEKAILAGNFAGPSAPPDVLILGELSFSDFLGWPFASWVASGKEIVFESNRFQVIMQNQKKFWGAVEGRAILLASSPELLDRALKKPGRTFPQQDKDVYVSIGLDPATRAGQTVRREYGRPPYGFMTHPLDLTSCTRAELGIEFGKKIVSVTARIHNARLNAMDLVPVTHGYLSFVPGENTFWVQPLLGDIQILWRQLDVMLAPAPGAGPGALSDFSMTYARQILQPLKEYGIEHRLFPYMGKGGILMAGGEMGIDARDGEGPFPALGLVLKIREKESKNVAYILEDLSKRLIGESKQVTMAPMEYQGVRMHFFYSTVDVRGVNSVFRPCYAVIKDHLVITTSLPYMHKILDRMSGEGADFSRGALYRQMYGNPPGHSREPVPARYVTGVNLHELSRCLGNMVPMAAAHAADNDQLRIKHRARLVKEFPGADDQLIANKVYEALRQEEQELVRKFRGRIAILDYIQHAVVRCRLDGSDVSLQLEFAPAVK